MSIKRYQRMSYLLFGAMFFIVSCTDNIVNDGSSNSEEEEKDLIPIVLNLEGLFGNDASTYSLTDGGEQPGTGAENTINDVTVFVFNSSNACEKIIKRTSPPIDNPIGPELVKTGNKTFITVVNGVGKLPVNYNEGDHASVSYNGLRQMLTNAANALPGAPFLMTGETTATLSLQNSSTPNQVTMEVKRAVAKIKIFVTKSDNASTHNIDMQKITLYNGANRVYLLQNPMDNQISYNVSLEKTSFAVGSTPNSSVPNKVVPPTTQTYCELADTFYTYESLCGSDKSKAIYFELEASVNTPANVRKARVYLAEDVRSPGDTIYNIHRNYWYNVYINIKDPGMDSVYITVKSCPWNVADTQKVETVGGYQVVDMAKPFKLVKNYTPSEFAQHPTFAAIEKHSKGASWLDLIVTENYPWKLEFTAGAENIGAKMSADGGATWHDEIVNIGDDVKKRIYIYRPYVENAEPESGPTFSLTVGGTITGGSYTGGTRVRDFVVQPRDTVPVPTNCYVLRPRLTGTPLNETRAYIPLKGVYRYWEDYLLNNGDTIPLGNVTAEVLWQEHLSSSGNVVNSVNIVNTSNKRDEAYIYVEAGAEPGNAVVAMKVGSTVYWSFHIWVTEYNPYEAAGQKIHSYEPPSTPSEKISNIFMDRNLGALSNKYTADGKATGLYYQYGRKDPFYVDNSTGLLPGGIFTTNNTYPTTSSPPSFRPLAAIPEMLYNPTTFYYHTTDDWPLSLEDTCLWNTPGGKKTAFDPCPEGWRIPKQKTDADSHSPWAGLTEISFGLLADGRPTSDPALTDGRYHLDIGYYPFSGWIEGYRVNYGSGASYWTSLNSNQPSHNRDGIGLLITESQVSLIAHIQKSLGASVRCVVDRQYILETASSGGGLFGNSAGEMEEDIIE